MVHYLLLKVAPDYDIDQVAEQVEHTYSRIERQVSGVSNVRVFRNCVDRDSNADLMIRLELERKGVLNDYLEHELHKGFVTRIGGLLIQRMTFDTE